MATTLGYSFVVGSTMTPFLLGLFVMNELLGAPGLITPAGVLGGLAVLALTVVDGAAFLGQKTRGTLRDDASMYGVRAALSYLGLAVLMLGPRTRPARAGTRRLSHRSSVCLSSRLVSSQPPMSSPSVGVDTT